MLALARAKKAFTNPELEERAAWFAGLLSRPAEISLLSIYLQFAYQNNIRFFPMFDGYDYIQAADFISETSHSVVLNAIAEWVIEDRARIRIEASGFGFRPLIQITMRACTEAFFWKPYSPAFGQIESITYHIVPPHFKDLFDKIFLLEEISKSNPKEDLDKVFFRINDGLTKELAVGSVQISDLFVDNVRHRVNFVRNVFEELARIAMSSFKDQNNIVISDLIEKIKEGARDLSDSKSYRLVNLLLHSKNEIFSNFVRIDNINQWLGANKPPFLSEMIVKDNNVSSGYIGNVFNYHIPYAKFADLAFFLEKIRILEVLHANRPNGLSKNRIRAEFAIRGWPLSNYFDVTLAILIREVMIRVVYLEPDGAAFQIDRLGAIVFTTLLYQMAYLENVFFGCLLPGALRQEMINIERNSSKRTQWVAAAIFHMWILLRLVATAEGGQNGRYFTAMRVSVVRTINTILQASPGESEAGDRAERLTRTFSAKLKL